MLSFLFEKALKNAIKYHPELGEKCRVLGEKDILITLLPLKKEWTIIFAHGAIRCYEGKGLRKADLHISGTPQAFIAMMVRDDKTGILLEGDAVLGQTLQQFFSYDDIDWENLFNGILGESLGEAVRYPTMTFLRKSAEMIQSFHHRTKIKIADQLQEDTDCLPLPSEVESFCNEVDELKLRLDRLEARWNLLIKEG